MVAGLVACLRQSSSLKGFSSPVMIHSRSSKVHTRFTGNSIRGEIILKITMTLITTRSTAEDRTHESNCVIN
jgi:hypothetical protein